MRLHGARCLRACRHRYRSMCNASDGTVGDTAPRLSLEQGKAQLAGWCTVSSPLVSRAQSAAACAVGNAYCTVLYRCAAGLIFCSCGAAYKGIPDQLGLVHIARAPQACCLECSALSHHAAPLRSDMPRTALYCSNAQPHDRSIPPTFHRALCHAILAA